MSTIQTLLARIADLLSDKHSREETLQQSMTLLLSYSEVCRVYYFELVESNSAAYLANLLYEVCADGIVPQIDNPDVSR